MSTIIDTYQHGGILFQLHAKTFPRCTRKPTVTINAPQGTLILGGGAYVDWDGQCAPPCPQGNMLTAMYPNASGTTWTVASKDSIPANNARITAYCIVARGIAPADYTVAVNTAVKTAQAKVLAGFTVVGGGAMAGTGWLTESYPLAPLDATWVGTVDSGLVRVWAIGLKKTFLLAHTMTIKSIPSIAPSPAAKNPKKTDVIPNFNLTGAGAKMGATGLLTASFPQDRQTVVAEGIVAMGTATVTAYAVGFF